MKIIYTTLLIGSTLFSTAQKNILRINPSIVLPQDSAESRKLTSSLNNFLVAAQQPNEDNKWVYEPEKIETFILLDEINGIEQSGKYKEASFYKPYLSNAVLQSDHTYLIQVSYLGAHGDTALLRASFDLVAHKNGNAFVFSSMLITNTKHWKTEKAGNTTFHYLQTINKTKVKEFATLAGGFDQKLKVTNKQLDYYLCDNLLELEKLIGVAYKSDYNGQKGSAWSSQLGNRKLLVIGDGNAQFNDFDPHDLWHDRLSLAISRRKTNKPVDEACAYLYGGSWGISWPQILKSFNEKVASNKTTNWMDLKENPLNFGESDDKHLYADYVVNALIVKKLEKEKGFSAVWELLTVGPIEKGNENYYKALEKLTGISKATYNEKVWELINNEK